MKPQIPVRPKLGQKINDPVLQPNVLNANNQRRMSNPNPPGPMRPPPNAKRRSVDVDKIKDEENKKEPDKKDENEKPEEEEEPTFLQNLISYLRLIVVIITSTADYISDIIYISTQNFYNPFLFFSSLAFVFLPSIIWWLFFDIKSVSTLISVWYKTSSHFFSFSAILLNHGSSILSIYTIFLRWVHLDFLSIFDIKPANIRPQRADSLAKFLIMCSSLLLKYVILPIILAISILVLAIFSIILAPVLAILFLIYLFFFFIFTIFVFLVFTISTVIFFFILPAFKLIYFPTLFKHLSSFQKEIDSKKDINIDPELKIFQQHVFSFNLCVVVEMVFESIPQSIIVIINVLYLKDDNIFFWLTISFSLLSVVNTLWPFLYNLLCDKQQSKDWLKIDLFNFKNIIITPSSERKLSFVFLILFSLSINLFDYLYLYNLSEFSITLITFAGISSLFSFTLCFFPLMSSLFIVLNFFILIILSFVKGFVLFFIFYSTPSFIIFILYIIFISAFAFTMLSLLPFFTSPAILLALFKPPKPSIHEKVNDKDQIKDEKEHVRSPSSNVLELPSAQPEVSQQQGPPRPQNLHRPSIRLFQCHKCRQLNPLDQETCKYCQALRLPLDQMRRTRRTLSTQIKINLD